jgi:hypothetical protein
MSELELSRKSRQSTGSDTSRVLVLALLGVAVLVSAIISFQHAEISVVLSSMNLQGDKYQALLHREKSVLHSGPGGLDWGNRRFLDHASDEQQAYIAEKNQKAMIAVKQVRINPRSGLKCPH